MDKNHFIQRYSGRASFSEIFTGSYVVRTDRVINFVSNEISVTLNTLINVC